MLHKTKTGKALALLLAAVMLFAGIPFSTSAEGDGTELQLENLFRSGALVNKYGILMDVASGDVTANDRFSAAAVAATVDGDTQTEAQVYGALDYEYPKYVGAVYELDKAYDAERFVIYSGYDNLKDTIRVYASDSMDTLYDKSSIVVDDAECGSSAYTESIGKKVQYVAVVIINYEGNPRPKEFELWGAAEEEPVETDNLFHRADGTDAIESSRGITMNAAQGYVKDKATIDQTVIDGLTDGDITVKYDLQTSTEWYYGVEFSLDSEYYADHLTIYALSDPADTYRVYASATLGDLYKTESQVADSVSVPANTAIDVEIGKNVRYVAVLSTVPSGNARPTEFELWSGEGAGDEPEEPEPDESLKVLTIGNSFSENASAYASEIAAVNGLSLTFGYLKFPSCTIARHYEAAVNNKAVFKFEITDPTGKRTTIKQEAASWDSPDSKKCATIREALEYMDWDVIVFQQESYTSLDASSFADLPKLIEYVKGFCPDARLMIHEVWAWGTWENDPDKNFSKIKANYEAAAEANGLAIIPSGLGFEYAREALGDYTIVNEDDGNYQHANSYGKYVAGCCYVGALFGVIIDPDTFKEHAEINKDGYAEQLTAAANKAILYYSSCAEGNHSYVEKVDAEYLKSAATCTKKAVYYKSCSVCGDKSDETFEYGDVDGTKHGETEVRDAVAATEEQEGYTGDTYCKDCGKKIASGTTIPKLEHTHNLVKTEAKPATHYEAGNLEYYRCSVCGKYYKDSDATVETTLEEVTIAKGEHSYSYKSDENGHWEECECGDKLQSAAHTFGQWVVTKDPTATEKGSQERTCSVCGYREVAEIDAIGGATEPEDPSSGEQNPPVTGRDASFVMLAFILLMSSAGIGAVAVKAKRKPQ